MHIDADWDRYERNRRARNYLDEVSGRKHQRRLDRRDTLTFLLYLATFILVMLYGAYQL